MRFLAGVVVGIVIGRPVLNVVNEHLTPPVRRKIVNTLNRVTKNLTEKIEQEDEG